MALYEVRVKLSLELLLWDEGARTRAGGIWLFGDQPRPLELGSMIAQTVNGSHHKKGVGSTKPPTPKG